MTEPGQQDQQAPARSAFREYLALLSDRPWHTVTLVAASILSGVSESAVLVLVAEIATAIIDGADRTVLHLGPFSVGAGIGALLVLALMLALARLILQLLIAFMPSRIASNVQARLRKNLFAAFSRASWHVQAQEREGHLQELMTFQVAQATYGVLHAATFVSAALMFTALVGSAFFLSVSAALVVLGSAAVIFFALRPLEIASRRQARELSATQLEYASGTSEAVRLAEETQVFGVADAQCHRIDTLVDNARHGFFRTQMLGRLVPATYQSLIILLLVAGVAVLYVTDAERLAALGAVVLILLRASTYGQQAQSSYNQFHQTFPFLERIIGAERRYRESTPARGIHPFRRVRTIAFEHVSFAYRQPSLVLTDVSFEVNGGEAVAIVGPSGAGKSTLVQLLLRLREPTSGRFLVNGEQASAISLEQWRGHVAYLPQNPQLLLGTVAENIRFFRDLDDRAVEQAARLAGIDDEIASWPNGYGTVISERAEAVSGGQRQRLCLARALAGEPEVLVLDEPTSALDLHSEAVIQKSLAALRSRLTLFVVAHRLSTLRICTRAMVVVNGQLEAFGDIAEVERADGFFRSTLDLAAAPRETSGEDSFGEVISADS